MRRMQPGKDYHLALVTAPNISAARKIATLALKEKLAACANLIPKIESHYWWQDQIESSSEVLILFKTTKAELEALEKCVLKNHPYETPEFVVLKIDRGSAKYLSWISDNTGGK